MLAESCGGPLTMRTPPLAFRLRFPLMVVMRISVLSVLPALLLLLVGFRPLLLVVLLPVLLPVLLLVLLCAHLCVLQGLLSLVLPLLDLLLLVVMAMAWYSWEFVPRPRPRMRHLFRLLPLWFGRLCRDLRQVVLRLLPLPWLRQ